MRNTEGNGKKITLNKKREVVRTKTLKVWQIIEPKLMEGGDKNVETAFGSGMD